jgi:hypothetical protein
MAKKKVKPASARPTSRVKPKAPAKAGSSQRVKWLDDKSGAPLIEKYARELGSFMEAVADGRVEDAEVKEQEGRLVQLMKEIEPKLDDGLHAKVTRLLCELTAYDLMQVLNSLHKAMPKAVFRG